MTAIATVRRHILPPNASALERAIDETVPDWDRIADAFAPPGAGGELPGFAPWLAAEYELAEFAPYFPTVQELIAEGLRWLFERGTLAAALRALRWIGFPDARIEEQRAYLHIHCGRLPEREEVRRIVHVVRASLPAHVALYRLVHGLDRRPVVLDAGPRLDVGLLDSYSGVFDAENSVVVSFGRNRTTRAPSPLQQAPVGRRTTRRIGVSRYDDMPVLDTWRLDSRLLQAITGGLRKQRSAATSAPPLGGGIALRRSVRVAIAPRLLPAVGAVVMGHRRRCATAAVPVSPPRRWAGPWGGPWREPIYLINRYTKD